MESVKRKSIYHTLHIVVGKVYTSIFSKTGDGAVLGTPFKEVTKTRITVSEQQKSSSD